VNLKRFDQIFQSLDARNLSNWECYFILSLLDRIESGNNLSKEEEETFNQIYRRSIRLA